MAFATVEIKRRIASLIPETNRGKYAETAGGPFRFTRNLQTGRAGIVMGPGSFRPERS